MKTVKLHFYYILFISFAFNTSIDGQKISPDQSKTKIANRRGAMKHIIFNAEEQPPLESALDLLKEKLKPSEKDKLEFLHEKTDNLGFIHRVYQQYHNNIKVEHALYKIHARGGKVTMMNGEFLRISDLDTDPAINEAEALKNALDFIGARKYMWQSAGNESFAKKAMKAETFKPSGELVIIQDYFTETFGKHMLPVLAWKFNIYAEKPLSRDWVYVNAKDGTIALADAILKNCHAHEPTCTLQNHEGQLLDNNNLSVNLVDQGTAATRYSGVRSIETQNTTSGYFLHDVTRGGGIVTKSMNSGTDYSHAEDLVDNDNYWNDNEYENSEKDDALLDAHWGVEMTFDYFKNVHGRNSYDDNNARVKVYGHYDHNYNNAFWNGKSLNFGDGDGTKKNVYTSLDIVAHEFGHAVCSNTANLVYLGESGALNEGLSDIWGSLVENYAAPEKNHWLNAEEIQLNSGKVAGRSLQDPKSLGDPDTYMGEYWLNPYCGSYDASKHNDKCGVHTNSGVINHWYYLLSEGGSGTNDNNDSYAVTGIGIDAAAQIIYRMESIYMGSNSDYSDTRVAGIQAATDIYGANSDEVISTTNAFYAVGVGPEYGVNVYCSLMTFSDPESWLTNVQMGDFSNASGMTKYSDFTNKRIHVTAGYPIDISLEREVSDPFYYIYPASWNIWIDYNNDLDFDDPGEWVFNHPTNENKEINASFIINAKAANVNTRMRVTASLISPADPCESFVTGEVEDYTIVINAADSCAAPGILEVHDIAYHSVDVKWDEVPGAINYQVYLKKDKEGHDWKYKTTTDQLVTTLSGLSEDTNYEVKVLTDCAGFSSEYTLSLPFKTL